MIISPLDSDPTQEAHFHPECFRCSGCGKQIHGACFHDGHDGHRCEICGRGSGLLPDSRQQGARGGEVEGILPKINAPLSENMNLISGSSEQDHAVTGRNGVLGSEHPAAEMPLHMRIFQAHKEIMDMLDGACSNKNDTSGSKSMNKNRQTPGPRLDKKVQDDNFSALSPLEQEAALEMVGCAPHELPRVPEKPKISNEEQIKALGIVFDATTGVNAKKPVLNAYELETTSTVEAIRRISGSCTASQQEEEIGSRGRGSAFVSDTVGGQSTVFVTSTGDQKHAGSKGSAAGMLPLKISKGSAQRNAPNATTSDAHITKETEGESLLSAIDISDMVMSSAGGYLMSSSEFHLGTLSLSKMNSPRSEAGTVEQLFLQRVNKDTSPPLPVNKKNTSPPGGAARSTGPSKDSVFHKDSHTRSKEVLVAGSDSTTDIIDTFMRQRRASKTMIKGGPPTSIPALEREHLRTPSGSGLGHHATSTGLGHHFREELEHYKLQNHNVESKHDGNDNNANNVLNMSTSSSIFMGQLTAVKDKHKEGAKVNATTTPRPHLPVLALPKHHGFAPEVDEDPEHHAVISSARGVHLDLDTLLGSGVGTSSYGRTPSRSPAPSPRGESKGASRGPQEIAGQQEDESPYSMDLNSPVATVAAPAIVPVLNLENAMAAEQATTSTILEKSSRFPQAASEESVPHNHDLMAVTENPFTGQRLPQQDWKSLLAREVAARHSERSRRERFVRFGNTNEGDCETLDNRLSLSGSWTDRGRPDTRKNIRRGANQTRGEGANSESSGSLRSVQVRRASAVQSHSDIRSNMLRSQKQLNAPALSTGLQLSGVERQPGSDINTRPQNVSLNSLSEHLTRNPTASSKSPVSHSGFHFDHDGNVHVPHRPVPRLDMDMNTGHLLAFIPQSLKAKHVGWTKGEAPLLEFPNLARGKQGDAESRQSSVAADHSAVEQMDNAISNATDGAFLVNLKTSLKKVELTQTTNKNSCTTPITSSTIKIYEPLSLKDTVATYLDRENNVNVLTMDPNTFFKAGALSNSQMSELSAAMAQSNPVNAAPGSFLGSSARGKGSSRRAVSEIPQGKLVVDLFKGIGMHDEVRALHNQLQFMADHSLETRRIFLDRASSVEAEVRAKAGRLEAIFSGGKGSQISQFQLLSPGETECPPSTRMRGRRNESFMYSSSADGQLIQDPNVDTVTGTRTDNDETFFDLRGDIFDTRVADRRMAQRAGQRGASVGSSPDGSASVPSIGGVRLPNFQTGGMKAVTVVSNGRSAQPLGASVDDSDLPFSASARGRSLTLVERPPETPPASFGAGVTGIKIPSFGSVRLVTTDPSTTTKQAKKNSARSRKNNKVNEDDAAEPELAQALEEVEVELVGTSPTSSSTLKKGEATTRNTEKLPKDGSFEGTACTAGTSKKDNITSSTNSIVQEPSPSTTGGAARPPKLRFIAVDEGPSPQETQLVPLGNSTVVNQHQGASSSSQDHASSAPTSSITTQSAASGAVVASPTTFMTSPGVVRMRAPAQEGGRPNSGATSIAMQQGGSFATPRSVPAEIGTPLTPGRMAMSPRPGFVATGGPMRPRTPVLLLGPSGSGGPQQQGLLPHASPRPSPVVVSSGPLVHPRVVLPPVSRAFWAEAPPEPTVFQRALQRANEKLPTREEVVEFASEVASRSSVAATEAFHTAEAAATYLHESGILEACGRHTRDGAVGTFECAKQVTAAAFAMGDDAEACERLNPQGRAGSRTATETSPTAAGQEDASDDVIDEICGRERLANKEGQENTNASTTSKDINSSAVPVVGRSSSSTSNSVVAGSAELRVKERPSKERYGIEESDPLIASIFSEAASPSPATGANTLGPKIKGLSGQTWESGLIESQAKREHQQRNFQM
ncbi:unnamed protein product [Amoebophrya sp. A25]|nr:unnamed protein product [Amoebophrya sp. A25]|eukprot:GSA25T00025125001.1